MVLDGQNDLPICVARRGVVIRIDELSFSIVHVMLFLVLMESTYVVHWHVLNESSPESNAYSAPT